MPFRSAFSQDETCLGFFTVHVEGGQFIVNELHSYYGQGGLLLELTDRPLHVLHDHLGITAHMPLILHRSDESPCKHLYWHIQKKIQYLPVFPSHSYDMRFLTAQKLLQIFNVESLQRTNADSKPHQPRVVTSDALPGLLFYLLLSLLLSEGIPPLHEIRQTQEVDHLSLPVNQSTEHWCISRRRNTTVILMAKIHSD